MIQVIFPGSRWLFLNGIGYGFLQTGSNFPPQEELCHNGPIEAFVTVLKVADGCETRLQRCFFVAVANIRQAIVFDRAEAEAMVARDPMGTTLYEAVLYPPVLPERYFWIDSWGDELVARPTARVMAEDEKCLLLFGGTAWDKIEEGATTGSVLRAVRGSEKSFGVAILEPGQAVVVACRTRYGYDSGFCSYRWDGQMIRVVGASQLSQLKAF